MKKLILLFAFCGLFLASSFGQAPPQAFNYSAVARDAQSNPIANQTIGIQISILQTSSIGSVVYAENHFVNTDQYGLFNLIIGSGSIQSGNMSAIEWSVDTYYLKVGMDANGGTNFLTMGITQLISVPYALHAATADSIIGGVSTAEVDPLFAASLASTITAADTSSWNLDNDESNELQTISISNDTIYLSNGGFVVLPAASGNNGTSLPTVVTDSLVAVNGSNSRFYGKITSNGNELILKSGFVYSTSANPTINDNYSIVTDSNGIVKTGVFQSLDTNTTYYVRCFATNVNGTAYGNELSFTTASVTAPIVTVNGFSNVNQTYADVDFIISDFGNNHLNDYRILYSTSPNPTIGDGISQEAYINGYLEEGVAMNSTMPYLEYNTTYYVRVYVSNGYFSVYSNEMSFTSLDCMLSIDQYTVNISNPTEAYGTGDQLNGEGCFGPNGYSNGTHGTVYSTSPNPTLLNGNVVYSNSFGSSDFGSFATNPGTTYYCRGFVITQQDTVYTADVVYVAPTGLGDCILNSIANITSANAEISWDITDEGYGLVNSGLCYSTSPNPTTSDLVSYDGYYIGSFYTSIYLDFPSTTYYVRAFVETSYGTIYSNEMSFTTAP